MKSPIFNPVVVAIVIDIVELEIETPEDNVAEIPEYVGIILDVFFSSSFDMEPEFEEYV